MWCRATFSPGAAGAGGCAAAGSCVSRDSGFGTSLVDGADLGRVVASARCCSVCVGVVGGGGWADDAEGALERSSSCLLRGFFFLGGLLSELEEELSFWLRLRKVFSHWRRPLSYDMKLAWCRIWLMSM